MLLPEAELHLLQGLPSEGDSGDTGLQGIPGSIRWDINAIWKVGGQVRLPAHLNEGYAARTPPALCTVETSTL